MKRIIAPLVLALVLAFSTGCYGSYTAHHALNRWNGHATGNKYINSAIHFLFYIPLPVYPLALAGDFFIFNNIEFFTGSRVFN